MADINAQMILDKLDMPVGATIPLPYGLTLEITMPSNLDELCDTADERQAIDGLLGVCQGVLITLSEATLLDIASLVMLVNSHLGLIVFVRDRGIVDLVARINPNASVEEFINDCIAESGIIEAIQEEIPEIPFQYLEFEEIVPLWWKIVNSRLIYVLRDNYTTTSYSANTGLEEIAVNFFGG